MADRLKAYLEQAQDDAILLHALAIGVDELLDGIVAEQSPALKAVRAIVNVIIERADSLQNDLDRTCIPYA